MSYAAEALVSAAPPPSKPAASKSAPQPQDASAPSFDDHIAAESQDAPVQTAPAAREVNARDEAAPIEANASDEPSSADTSAEATPQPAPQTPPPIVVAPVLVQLIVQTNTAPATDADSAPMTPDAPANIAPPSAPLDAAAPSDAKAPQANDSKASAPPAPEAMADHAKPEAAPIAKTGEPSIALPNNQAPAPVQGEALTPRPDAAPIAQQAQAPPPQVIAQATTIPRTQTAPVEVDTESGDASETPPAPVSTAPAPTAPTLLASAPTSPPPRVAPEAASTPVATAEAPPELEIKTAAKSDDGSVQEKFEAALEKSAPRADVKVDSARPSIPNAPIVVADATGAVAANADTSIAAAPSVSALGAATTHAAAQTQALSAEHLSRSAPPAAQVAREIVRRFDGESTRFELRLDPPELGRVEVKLEITRDHKVTAVIAADSPQALTELARHARELEQNLQAAGLELSDNGLSFDLRQSREDAQDANGDGGRGDNSSADTDTVETQAPLARPIGLERWRGVRVDVMA
jgi:flagellar hook-length control protein FliK